MFIITNKVKALIKKEILEIKREKSGVFIAIIMPFLLTVLFGLSVSFDFSSSKIGILIEGEKTKNISNLISSINGSKYLEIKKIFYNRKEISKTINLFNIKNILIIPADFEKTLQQKRIANFEIISDAVEPNGSKIITSYISQAINLWVNEYNSSKGIKNDYLHIETKFWYNNESNSNYGISIGVVMFTISVVGTLLTAMVVSREWEIGTMEQLMSTSVSIEEIILSKIIPYFMICSLSFGLSFILSKIFFSVPFVGSFILYTFANLLFCLIATSQGILVSVVAKNQFVASQLAFLISFLPTMLLSGLIFDINSMPKIVQIITYIFPAKYILELSNTIVLIGNNFYIYAKNITAMLIFESLLINMIKKKAIKKF